MKKLRYFFIIPIFLPLFLSAQTGDSTEVDLANQLAKIFGASVQMDIDSNLYPEKQGTFHMSQDPLAMIMTMVAPQSFEKAREHLEKESSKKGTKIKHKGEFDSGSRTFLFQKGTIKKDGHKMIIEMYAVAADEKSTIYITGFHDIKAKDKYKDSIRNAAISARVVAGGE